jgi:hypothetical protein
MHRPFDNSLISLSTDSVAKGLSVKVFVSPVPCGHTSQLPHIRYLRMTRTNHTLRVSFRRGQGANRQRTHTLCQAYPIH